MAEEQLHSGLVLDGHKLNCHHDRVEAWLAGERIAPITIDCSLTRKCTFRCKYCYGQLQENDEQKLTQDVISRFLDDAAEMGVRGISFVSDGESTCSPHLTHAILRGKANGLDIALGTNGYLLKDLDSILPALTYIRFNISAADPQRYCEIHGVNLGAYEAVLEHIRQTVEIRKQNGLDVTIGLQMVLLPKYADQVMPLAVLGKELGVDYFIIKHCSDDERGTLGVDYSQYEALVDLLARAEEQSTDEYLVRAKWSKILSLGERRYRQCYGPAFIMQFSGSGLVAPCGMLFNRRFKKFHIGNIAEQSLKEMWQGEQYWKVLRELGSKRYDATTMCGSLCLQHKCNEFLWDLKRGTAELEYVYPEPQHVNFV